MVFDYIYHEHLSYFSILPLVKFFKKFKMRLIQIQELPTKGGSLRYFWAREGSNWDVDKNVGRLVEKEIKANIRLSTFNAFRSRIDVAKEELINFLQYKKKGKIIGYGATAKSTTVLNFCKIKSETLDYFLDTTPGKTGKFMPGSHLYVQRYNKILTNQADYVFLGAWNFKKEIFKKERKYIKKGGKFITHVPTPKII